MDYRPQQLACLLLTMVVGLAVGCAHRPTAQIYAVDGVYECQAVRSGQIALDGLASEKAWRRAPVMSDFVTAGPNPRPALAATRVRMLQDGQRLLFFFECDSPAFRTYGSQRDDEIWNGEAAEIFLAPEGADKPYYEININPDGVIFDSRIHNWRYEVLVKHHREWAQNYNANVEAAIRRRYDAAGEIVGWDVELAIPFADLGMPEGIQPGQAWRFNVCRAAPLPNGEIEFSTWHSTGADFHRPHQFARLRFK